MEKVTVSDKDLPNQNEDNRYEPSTFELKPEPNYEPDKAKHRSSSSSSSTDSEDDGEFIQLDTIAFTNKYPNPPPNNDSSVIPCKNPNSDQSLFLPTLQPVCSTQPVETTNIADVWAPQSTGRIPSSIFTTQSKVPMEWSVASAESLFSLNFSNSSISRENASVSGLPSDLPTPVSDANLELFSGPLAVVEEIGEGANDEVVRENGVELGTCDGKLVDVSVPRRSDGSVSSLQSFAFPVLTGDENAESIKVESQSDESPDSIKVELQPHESTESIKLGSQPHESSESIKVESQLQPQPQLPAPSTSSMSIVPEPETKSEPKPELPPSSNIGQLTQPPQPQIMEASDKVETSTVMESTGATSENAGMQAATKTSSTTSMGSGSSCSCCSFCS